jgi:hypothetical protein
MLLSHPVHAAFNRYSQVLRSVLRDHHRSGLEGTLGGYEYGGSINQIFHGWIGDLRIVNRALRVDEFMIAQ